MITEKTLHIARATAEELRVRGEAERAEAIDALVDAARLVAVPMSGEPTNGDIGELVGATGQQIKNWVLSGQFSSYRVGGHFVIPKDVMEEYVRLAGSSLDFDEVSDEEAARLVAEGRSPR